ncbi:MAG: hypothetical protein HY712_06410 [candidate division NC10 bacterium]|nr:hypothetical protein [candidate division NC10 bacterium]
MSLIHLGCPHCAAPIALAEGQRIVRCAYCGADHLALVPDQVPRYAVALGLDRAAAEAAVAGVLAGPAMPGAVRGRVRPRHLCLYYVPFYEWSGIRLGAFLLRDRKSPRLPVSDTEGDPGVLFRPESEPQETVETHIIEQEWLRLRPACDHPELGVAAIPLERLRRERQPVTLERFDPVRLQVHGVVLPPTRTPEALLADGEGAWRSAGDRTRVVERRVRLLYYPVWRASYTFRGRLYDLAIDGVTGALLTARAPRDIRPAALGVALVLGGGSLAFGRASHPFLVELWRRGAVSLLPPGALGVAAGLLGGGLLTLFLAWLAWKLLQRDGDVMVGEEGEVRGVWTALVVQAFTRGRER